MIDYDAHDWRSHLLDVKGSMLREISSRVALLALWSAAIVVVDKYLENYHQISLAVSSLGHVLIGIALSLLLVFRTNSSYDRFWEGRKLWGAIVNESRNLARGASVFLAKRPEIAIRLIHWTIAFAWSAMHHLREKKSIGPIAEQLPMEEVKSAVEANHTPLAVSLRMSEQLSRARQEGAISDYLVVMLDQNVQLLIDAMGGCERIRKTPLPFAYVVHLRRAMIFYCSTLPFALLETFGWGAIVVTILITYTLFGIEEIGVEIEGPFGADDNDLPLEQICTSLQANLDELARDLAKRTDAA